MSSENKYIIIVNAFSSGKYLSNQLKNDGFNIIHVLTKEGKYFYKEKLNYSYFYKCIDFTNKNWEVLLKSLDKFNIKAVIPGCELGVYVAEKLAFLLGFKGNDPRTTDLRRNKSLMQTTLAKYNLDIIKEIVLDKENYMKQLQNFCNYPCILKTIDDGGSINVYHCKNKRQVVEYSSMLFGSRNIMDKPINKLLLQEKINGKEFIINTISIGDKHFITDMWSYKKKYIKNGGVIIEKVFLENYKNYYKEFVSYINTVLSALGVEYGASHIEVFYTDKGLRLIELGARIMGGEFDRALWSRISSISQVDAISKILNNEKLEQNMFFRKARFCFVLFPSYEKGIVEDVLEISNIKHDCKSLYKYKVLVKKGDSLDVAKDDEGPFLASFMLIHNNDEIFKKDLQYIESLENKFIRICDEK